MSILNFNQGKWQLFALEGGQYPEVYVKLFDEDGNFIHEMHLISCDNCNVGIDAMDAFLNNIPKDGE